MISLSWHFFIRPFSIIIKTSSVFEIDTIAVRLNRVIKIVCLSSLLSATRNSANNMARCLMTRSITILSVQLPKRTTQCRTYTYSSTKRNRNSIAEYQRAIDDFLSFLSWAVKLSYAIIPRAKVRFLYFCLYNMYKDLNSYFIFLWYTYDNVRFFTI